MNTGACIELNSRRRSECGNDASNYNNQRKVTNPQSHTHTGSRQLTEFLTDSVQHTCVKQKEINCLKQTEPHIHDLNNTYCTYDHNAGSTRGILTTQKHFKHNFSWDRGPGSPGYALAVGTS